jgi:adenylate kinase
MDNQTRNISSWLQTGSINIFGLPFAGKDTQGAILAEMFDGVMFSSGDILRHNKDNARLQQIMAEGGIIPSDLFEEIVVPYLAKPEFQDKALILSEVGRMGEEADIVLRACEASGHTTKAVILLKLSDEEVWRRFDEASKSHDRGERADDNKAVLQTRLDNYHAKVMPTIEFYRQQGLLIEIDGSLPKDEVTAHILSSLAERASKL